MKKVSIYIKDCTENTVWKTVDGNSGKGWTCNDYTSNKWCENGGAGNSLIPAWSWELDANGKDARDICCECGGKGILGEVMRKFTKNVRIYYK